MSWSQVSITVNSHSPVKIPFMELRPSVLCKFSYWYFITNFKYVYVINKLQIVLILPTYTFHSSCGNPNYKAIQLFLKYFVFCSHQCFKSLQRGLCKVDLSATHLSFVSEYVTHNGCPLKYVWLIKSCQSFDWGEVKLTFYWQYCHLFESNLSFVIECIYQHTHNCRFDVSIHLTLLK